MWESLIKIIMTNKIRNNSNQNVACVSGSGLRVLKTYHWIRSPNIIQGIKPAKVPIISENIKRIHITGLVNANQDN